MSIEKKFYAKTIAGDSYAYTLKNQNGYSVTLTDFGGGVVSIIMPDNKGGFADVALARSEKDFSEKGPMGATIGRFANRIANGRFTLCGKEYQLFQNDGVNTLHGGKQGFGQKMWKAETFETKAASTLKLTYVSPDGEENFPGELTLSVYYTLDNDNRFALRYEAESTKDTIINVTNHVYFNLNGHDGASVENHELFVDADAITPVIDAVCIPTGEYMNVEGTPFDLRNGRLIGEGLTHYQESKQMQYGHGYDHNFVLNTKGMDKPCCYISEKESGRRISVYTDQPGLQVYTANGIDFFGKDGAHYLTRQAVCLETQHYPDCVNEPSFPSCVLKAGEKFVTTTVYAMSVR
ncbi:MAG: galactose mutarotase [Eubacteriales bacterium]|nr:galactose mutarotase [Eubacteriales bacterium]MDD3881238.1 galactose mutarotase [Eubacteriales bacterium]MDD4512156.1 galactose mutarotase [Eubacteriales bacterium]